MDTRDQYQNDELLKLKRQLHDKQQTIQNQNKLVEVVLEQAEKTEEQIKDPYWEKSERSEDDWQQRLTATYG